MDGDNLMLLQSDTKQTLSPFEQELASTRKLSTTDKKHFEKLNQRNEIRFESDTMI
jgi:hypothetical protein